MFKRNVLKRTLPIMLSVAMTFQSVPITAMAAENPPTAVEQEAAEPEAQAEPEGGLVDGSSEAPAAEVTEETTAEVTEETTAEPTEETPEETPADGEETPAQDTETTPEDASGEESAPKEDADVSGTGTEGDGQETAGTESKTEVSADVSEETAEPEAEEVTGTVTPEIQVDPGTLVGFEFERGESTYTGEYAPDKLAGIKDSVKNKARVYVDGNEKPDLNVYISAKWQVKSGEEWKDVPEAETPENVGIYRLEFVIDKVDGLCEASEKVYVYFEIIPKKLTFDHSGIKSVKAGSKIEDFIADVKENGKIVKDVENNECLDEQQYEIEIAVFKAGESVAEQNSSYFSDDADYYYTVTINLEESMQKNYKLDSETEYRIPFDNENRLRKTEVEAILKNPGAELARDYEKGKESAVTDFVKAEDVTVTVKVESKNDSTDENQEEPAKPTFVPADDAEKAILGVPTAKWYTKETFLAGDSDTGDDADGDVEESEVFNPKNIDEKTQFVLEKGDKVDVYTLLPKDTIREVGEYYIVYVCEGKADQFEGSHSDPIQVTINPVPVILKPESVGALKFGMNKTAVDGVLAKVTSGLYKTADAMTAGDKVTEDGVGADGFYGVSYDDAGKTQYYSPVFELWYRTKARATETTPAATEWKWAANPLTSLEEFKPDTEKYEYEYYIVFTGKKAVYNANGVKQTEKDITETSTNTADQNYKVVADEDARFNVKDEKNRNALKVEIGEVKETTVDVEKIVSAFNGQHNYVASGNGAIESPARMVYDPGLSLFAQRDGANGYKQADVKDKDGTALSDLDRGAELTYTWEKLNDGYMTDYQELINTEEPADKKSDEYAAWEALKEELENDAYDDWEIDYSTLTPRDAGVYRLKIQYKDSKPEPSYASSVGYAYFLIEKQEIILKADRQYAEYGEPNVGEPNVGEQSQLWYGYSVYKVPGNNAAAQPELLEDWNADAKNPVWNAMTLNKDEKGNDIAGDWRSMSTSEIFIEDKDHPYTYKAAVWFDNDPSGKIFSKSTGEVVVEAGTRLDWKNYTTRNQDKDAWDAKVSSYKQHTTGYADILFGKTKIVLTVSGTVPTDREYNGQSIADTNPLTVTTSAGLPADEAQDAVSGVKVGWRWTDEDENVNKIVTTAEAIYGGTYTLVASFKGNDNYKALAADGEEYTDEWYTVVDKDGNDYTFTIKPREVEIAPKLREQVTAGTPLREMLAEDIDVKNIATGDEWLFKIGSGYIEDVTKATNSMAEYSGYPILAKANVEDTYFMFMPTYFVDNEQIERTDGILIRFGKNYNVQFDEADLFAQYALSYKISYKAATLTKEQIVRGDAEVWPVWFFYDGMEEKADRGSVEVDSKKVPEKPHTFEITPLEGIPFIYNSYSIQQILGETEKTEQGRKITQDIHGREIPLDKNYIAVDIVSPFEFSAEIEKIKEYGKNNFLYETSIRNAGGYVINTRKFEQNLSKDSYWSGRYYRYRITALFPVERGEDGNTVSPEPFDITWEKGYKETFALNLDGASLEANLKEAVAPKSIAFNGLVNKMAVGEEQQLDVKITKMQLGDVIRINYRLEKDSDGNNVTHNDYASVNPETGRITALSVNKDTGKPAQVTVQAYPVRLGEDGKTFEEIPEDAKGKPVKPATAKITINNVTAPVIKKLTAKDNTVEVQYTKVNDGYRREIYVVDVSGDNGKPDKTKAAEWKTANNFDEKIGELKNGQWKGTFAIAPKYVYGTGEDYNSKLKLCVEKLYNLNAGASYVVYVRNVSAVRTLADGSQVEESFAGSVKTISTTKSMVKGLEPYFDVDVTKTPEERTVDYIYEEDPEMGYKIDLADKTAQLSVYGIFTKKALENAKEAEDDEWLKMTLPIKATVKAASKNEKIQELLTAYPDIPDKYLEPKLSYYITDGWEKDYLQLDETDVVYDDDGSILYGTYGYSDFDDKGKLKNPSKYATIAKNGKISLKGVGKNGYAYVTLWVVSDNKLKGSCRLRINAKPDTVTVKKAKAMKVGDSIRLADYLEYKSDNGKVKVPNYWSSYINITNWDVVEKAGFEIHQVDSSDEVYDENDDPIGYRYKSVDGNLNYGEYIITAVEPGVSTTLKFEDWVYGEDDEPSKKVENLELALSSTELDPVKGLKTAYVDDKHITLNFAYAGHPDAFAIEVTDARGSVIFKRLAKVEDAMDNAVWAEDLVASKWKDDSYGSWLQNEQTGIIGAPLGYRGSDICFKYFEKTKTYAYTIKTEKLMRLSSYTITVDPVYNGKSAASVSGKKPATTKAKTTNIPASYGNADIQNPVWQYTNNNNNVAIGIQDAYGNESGPYFMSGNTYTLTTDVNNQAAQDRGTDTLTWKSSNTKVVSLKANQGSYSATLKAMQQGRATITVTSKITKKTIARYHVAVKAVGDGENYGGDFEYTNGEQTPFYDKFIKTYDPYYEGKLEVLTVSNLVNVAVDELLNYPGLDNSGEQDPYINRTWVQFTAPGYGEYTFSSSQSFDYYYGDKSRKGGSSNGYLEDLKLEEGQKIYFKVYGAFKLKVEKYTDFTKLTEGKPIKVTKDTWVSFTATEENYYTFDGGNEFEKDGSPASMTSNDDGSKSIGLKAGETIFILVKKDNTLSVEKRDLSVGLSAGENKITFNKDDKSNTQYRTFTALETGDYTFEYPKENVEVKFYSVNGEEVYENGKAVTAKAVPFAVGEETTPEEPTTDKTTLFIEADQKVVAEIKVDDAAFTSEAKTFEVVITVTGKKVDGISETEQTVTHGTDKTFEYTIPNDKEAAQYTVKAEGASIKWYDAAYDKIQFSGDKFVVENGAVRGIDGKIKAGDKIYIKVDATNAAEDVKVSIAKKTAKAVAVPANEPVVLKNGSEDWLTFAIKKAGYYEFTYKLEGESPKHGIVVQQYKGAFGSLEDENVINFVEAGADGIHSVTPGSYTFKVTATDSAADADQTNATLSVKEVPVTALKAGDNAVTLNSKDEVQYYSFKADSSYTIKWTPDKDTGAADVNYSVNSMDFDEDLPANTENEKGTYYIRVKQTGDAKVTGKLQVTGEVADTILVSGKAQSFPFKYGETTSVRYRFTTPEDSDLGYAVIVENTSKSAEENGPVPAITVSIDGSEIISDLGSGKRIADQKDWREAFKTKYITVDASGMAEKADATGTITVQPITPAAFTEQIGKIVPGDSKWYVYNVPADGRYSLSYELGKDQTGSVNVNWNRNNKKAGVAPFNKEAQYLKSGETIYVNVKEVSVADAGVDVTVSLKAIEPGKLELAADADTAEVELKADTPAYYTFTAPVDAAYTIDGSNGRLRMFVPKNGDLETYFTSGAELQANETILIPVGHDGKLTVTKKTIPTLVLNTASASVKLPAGDNASFAFTSYTDDYFDFTANVQENLSVEVVDYDGEYEADGYALIKGMPNMRWIIKVTNDSLDKEAEFTITAKKVDPVELELDKDVSVPVEKGRISLLTFAVPEDYRYKVTCGEGGQIVETAVNGDVVWYETEEDAPKILKLQYSGEAKTVNVKVSKLAPTEMNEGKAEVSLKDDESAWYAYKVPTTGEYTFSWNGSNIDYTLYKSLSNGDTMGSSVIMEAGAVIYVKATGYSSDETPKTEISFTSENLDVLEAGNQVVVDNSDSYDYKYVTFKAPADGFYQFSNTVSSGDSYSVAYLGDNPQNNGNYSLNSYRFFVMKDDEVFLRVDPQSSVIITVEKTREISADETLSVGKSKELTLEAETENWYTFTAPESGSYNFIEVDATNYNPSMYLYRSGDLQNPGYYYEEYCNAVSTGKDNTYGIHDYELEKGQKVYLKANWYVSSEAKYKINIQKNR